MKPCENAVEPDDPDTHGNPAGSGPGCCARPGNQVRPKWYWLNDWRRQQQQARLRFTYGDMADHLRSLMQAWMWLKAQPGPNTYAEFCRLNPQPFQQSS